MKHGRQLVINVVDERADSTPHQPFASLPKAKDPRAGFHDVNYGLLRRAVDHTARFLEQHIGKAKNFETFAWIGPPTDFRYILLALAAMKTGHKAFFSSPRNSLKAHVSLLDQCQCQSFLQAEEMPLPFMNKLLEQRPMKHVEVPGLDQMLFDLEKQSGTAPYLYSKQFEEARYDPCMVLHTSGSTGIPKAIVVKQGYFSTVGAYHDLPKIGAAEFALAPLEDCRAFMPFPNFHSAAIAIKLGFSVFFNSPMVSPPDGPLTADIASAFLEHANVEAGFLPPSILREMATESKAIESFKNVKYVCYGGAPLTSDVAQALQDKAHFINCLGVTEASLLPIEATAQEDLQYLHFSSNTGIRFDHVSKGQYEMILVRQQNLDLIQGIFVTFPELMEWPTRDLWSKHPSKADHWLYEGRTDDIIVFQNGEKLNPLTMEQTIESHPQVSAALVAGNGQFQASLLVEPREPLNDPDEEVRFLDRVWTVVDQANSAAVAHGQIDRSFMLVASPSKPFSRAGKGSVQRTLTLDRYADELNALYGVLEDTNPQGSERGSELNFSGLEGAKSSLRQALRQLKSEIDSDDADLFAHGLDSLQVINLIRRIKSANGGVGPPARVVYANPTITALASFLTTGSKALETKPMSRSEHMQAHLEDLSKDLPIKARSPSAKPKALTVLLTGSTGSLGSYLLDALLRSSRFEKVVCLNRGESASSRQRASHEARGLSIDFRAIEFLQGNISNSHFGLDDSTYHRLLHSVTHILHNAWPVDFNLSLPSFIPHMAFVRQLVNFASQSEYMAHLYFISTIGVTQHYASNSVVPEQIIEDWSSSQHIGYAESKHISELLLERATKLGLSASICRVGQIAGPVLHGTQGEWPKHEWLPSLIASSIHLGKIPSTLGPVDKVDWLPVDILSVSIVELLLNASDSCLPSAGEDDSQKLRIHHAVNPQKTSWSALLSAVRAKLPEPRKPQVVSFTEWVDALDASADQEGAMTAVQILSNPALKLLGFVQSLRTLSVVDAGVRFPILDVQQTASQSPVLSGCEPVNEKWMTLWMDQWAFR